MASLDGTLDPSDVLVLQEQVGAVQSVDSGTTCASVLAKITASSGKLKLVSRSQTVTITFIIGEVVIVVNKAEGFVLKCLIIQS